MGRQNTEHDFWGKVHMLGNCWEWQGDTIRGGYGVFRMNGPKRTSHRIAWELTFGPVPDGLLVLHECDNPPCCNPSHLVLGTHKKNRNDQTLRGRDHSTQRLATADVVELRRMFFTGVATCGELAAFYGIDPRTVQKRIHNPSVEVLALEARQRSQEV